MLDQETLATVVASTPLIAIDLVVLNEDNELLVGKRLNRPAQGYWFVPGGRVLKNESLAQAFKRLTRTELGTEMPIEHTRLLGVFEHFYNDSVFGKHIDTHYVNAAHVLPVNRTKLALPLGDQHDGYRWISLRVAEDDPDIHNYTKAYLPYL